MSYQFTPLDGAVSQCNVEEGHLVEELEQFCARLVDGADNRPSSSSQSFEQRHHLET